MEYVKTKKTVGILNEEAMCWCHVGIELLDKVSDLQGLTREIKTVEKQLILRTFLLVVRFMEKGE
jgi:hypothetical protein